MPALRSHFKKKQVSGSELSVRAAVLLVFFLVTLAILCIRSTVSWKVWRIQYLSASTDTSRATAELMAMEGGSEALYEAACRDTARAVKRPGSNYNTAAALSHAVEDPKMKALLLRGLHSADDLERYVCGATLAYAGYEKGFDVLCGLVSAGKGVWVRQAAGKSAGFALYGALQRANASQKIKNEFSQILEKAWYDHDGTRDDIITAFTDYRAMVTWKELDQ